MTLDLTGASMNQLDTYLNLCTEVYDLSKPNPPEDAYAFYRQYADEAKGPILEPMCGTGRFLLPLLQEGFDIHGFDASGYMLAALHVKAKTKHLTPTVSQCLIGDFNVSEKYNLIFIPSGSFCLMTDLATIKLALKTFYDHLSKDGLLLFEVETPKAVPQLGVWRGSVWQKSNGDKIMLSSLANMEDNVCRTIGKYELIHDNRIIQTEIEEYKIKIYDTHEITELLKKCGFKSIRIIKAFDRSSVPNENDESIVYECKKN